MREAQFVGMTADGEALVVVVGGEHVRVPADDRLRKALGGDGQITIPLETHLSPREVQHRIRAGESAADIAASAGVAVELVARFEGPPLDERRWHAEQVRRLDVDGETLESLVALAARDHVPSWDSWLDEDGSWRVRADLGDGRRATWAWDPRTHRLRARDDLARLIQSGEVIADDLDAVLRPVAAARQQAASQGPVRLEAVPSPPPEPVRVSREPETIALDEPEEPEAEPELVPPAAVEDEAFDEVADEQPAAAVARSAKAKRRASVPSWDDIVLGTAPRRPPSGEGA